MDLARHDLIWLESAAFGQISVENPGTRTLAEEWLRAGHPAIVRRAEIAWTSGIALGIPLPLQLGRKRIALFAPEQAIARISRPPLLSDAIGSAPGRWQHALRAAERELAACGAGVRVYGSLAWQHVTGRIYLRPQSDVDLLIEAGPDFDLPCALRSFRQAAVCTTPRLDGELSIEHDRAVAWRELLTGTPDVMTRSLHGVALESRAAIHSLLSRRRAA